MASAVLAARVLLAGVFVVAAVGKLMDLPGSRRALVGFGVSESVANYAGTLLPFLELAVAASLLVQPSARWGAAGALILLGAFVAGITRALMRGQTPDCHCFGRIHSAPAGRSQIGRNSVLAAVAAFVIVEGPGPTINGWVAARTAAEVVAVLLGTAVLLLLAACFQLWRDRERFSAAIAELSRTGMRPGLSVGTLAPDFSARDMDGAVFTLEDLRSRGLPVALIFGEPGCGPCSAILPALPRWQQNLAGTLTIGLVGLPTYVRYDRLAAKTGASIREVYERDPELAREVDELNALLTSYRLRATPSAVIVTSEGTIASATVDGRPAIEALIHLAVARRGAVGLAAGQVVAV
jgi:thiol-disulfide isomerase/thioredoxin